MKRLIISPVAALFWCAALFSQTVTNVEASQEGNNIVVSYDIDKASPAVRMSVSIDGGKTFSSPLKKVSGDVKDVQPGHRRIVWDVLSEVEMFSGDNIVFNVIADQKEQASASAVSYLNLMENKTKQKNTRFVFELGGTLGASLLDVYPSAEGRSSMCKGETFSIYGNIGILIKNTSICLFFEQIALPYAYRQTDNLNSWVTKHSDLSSEGYFGVDFRQYGKSSKFHYGARCGMKSAHLEEDKRSDFLIQGQFGYSPIKWMTINAYIGYPIVEIGITVNVPNIFRK